MLILGTKQKTEKDIERWPHVILVSVIVQIHISSHRA